MRTIAEDGSRHLLGDEAVTMMNTKDNTSHLYTRADWQIPYLTALKMTSLELWMKSPAACLHDCLIPDRSSNPVVMVSSEKLPELDNLDYEACKGLSAFA